MKQFVTVHKKNIILTGKIILSVVILWGMLLVYPFNAVSISEQGTSVGEKGDRVTLTKQESFCQNISGIGKKLYGIEMVFEKVEVKEQDTFLVRVYENENVVFERLVNTNNLVPNEIYYLMTDIPMDKNRTYIVEYTANAMQGQLVVAADIEYKYASSPNGYETLLTWGLGILALLAIWFGRMVMSNSFLKVSVCYLGGCLFVMYQFLRERLFSVLMENKILLLLYAIICLIILAAGCVNLYMLYIRKEERVERYFILNMLSWGMVYMLTFIPYTAPDELAHFAGANMQANRLMGIMVTDEKGQAYVRAEDETGRYNIEPGAEDIKAYYEHLADNTVETKYVPYTGRIMEKTHFVAYLPQSIGVITGRLLQLNNSWLLLIGRIFSLIAYTAIVYFAIRITPTGKWIFYWFSQIPIAIELAASYSYDSMSNAWVYLFLAVAMYYVVQKDIITLRDQLLIIAIAVIGLPIKAIYLPFVLLIALIGKEKFRRGRLEKIIFSFAGILTTLLSVVLINILKASAFLSSGTQIESASVSHVSDAVFMQQRPLNYVYVIPDFIRNLELYFRVTFHTLIERMDTYVGTMVGSKLGAMDVEIPYYVIYGFLFLLAVILILFRDNIALSKWQKAGMWGSVFISALMLEAIFILMTPRRKLVIMGVQGRYLLPMVFVILMTITIRNIKTEKRNSAIPILGLNSMNLLAILYSLSYMLNR